MVLLLKKFYKKLYKDCKPDLLELKHPEFWNKVTFFNYLLLPLSLFYFLGTQLRKSFVRPVKLQAKVICVGNATVGGAGKTQLIITLCELFSVQKLNYIVLCKGYGGNYKKPQIVDINSTPEIVGDEACELRNYALTIVSKQPSEAVNLIQQIQPDVVLMDDGMQNPSLHKDFTILVIDGTRSLKNQFLFPAGPFRQSFKTGLQESDAVVLVDQAFKLKIFHKNLFYAQILPKPFFLQNLNKQQKFIAFSGIGNPEKFFRTAKNCGIEIVKTVSFPDHHKYTDKDFIFIQNLASKYDASLITTRKDYVKIPCKLHKKILCLDAELKIAGIKKLFELIYEKIFKNS